MDPTPVIVDTDTASDDALALALAIRAESLSVTAVTTVAGNVGLDRATENAKAALAAAGASAGDPPVHEGARRPLLKDHDDAEDVHGPGGLGAASADTGWPSAGGHAADVIVDRARGDAEALICLGPLTNVALALNREPNLGDHLEQVWVMGGAANTLGNVTPAAEYNFWVDPDAAKLGVRELDVRMVDWGVSRRDGLLSDTAYGRLEAMETPLAGFVVDVSANLRDVTAEREGLAGAVQPDGLTVACAAGLAHDAATRYVDVDEREGLTRGYSLVDDRGVLGTATNASVVTGADGPGFEAMVLAACRGEAPESVL